MDMKRRIKWMSFLLLLGVCGGARAQSATPKDTVPHEVEEPAWMAKLYSEEINGTLYQDWVDSFAACRSTWPNDGKKTPYNKYIINLFKRWQKSVSQFVDADGRIQLPSPSEYRAKVAKLNTAHKQKSPRAQSTPVGQWEVLAPMVSYHYESKKATSWQSNIYRFIVSPHDPNVLYCGTETGMIFKTVDKGLNWTPCAPMHYFGLEVYALDISKQKADKLLAAVGTQLWLSTDGGNNWRDITPNTLMQFCHVRDVVFNPKNDNEIYVGTDEALWVSSNNGVNWKRVASGRTFDLQYSEHQDPILYALVTSLKKGVLLYQVSGSTATELDFGAENSVYFCAGRIAVTKADVNCIYVLGLNGWDNRHPFFKGKPKLMYSSDEGATWVKRDVNDQMNSMDKDGGQGYYDLVLAVSHTNPKHVFMGVLFLYSSHDGGETLDQYTYYFGGTGPEIGGYYGRYDMHTDMQQIWFSENSREMWLSTDGGMYYSTDQFDSEPQARNSGIYASEFWGFDQGWNEDIIVGGRNHNGDMVHMASYGDTTVTLGGSENPTGYVFLSNPRKVTFYDTQQKFIVPEDWRNPFVDFPNWWNFNAYPREDVTYGTGMEFHPHYAMNYLLVSSTHFGMRDATYDYRMLWRTKDDGLSYTLVKTFDENVTAYTISRSNPRKIVVGTVARIFCSMDGGKSFQEMNITPEMKKASYYKIAIHPTRENEIWVNTHLPGGIFRTTDNGENWENVSQGLEVVGSDKPRYLTRFFLTGNEKNAVYAIANVDFKVTSESYAGAGRIYYWDDEQRMWSDISHGLPPHMRIFRMLPFYKDGKVRIATDNGIWQMPLVDDNQTPIATPVILNVGDSVVSGGDLHFDSYSIVNQNGATWEWDFQPKPLYIDSYTVRNPVVRVDPDQTYNVTLKVTNADGESSTVTVPAMIWGDKPVSLTTTVSSEQDVCLQYTLLKQGEPIVFKSNGVSGSLTIDVYDANGKLLHSESGAQLMRVNWGSHPAGMYFYRISGDDYQKIGKFVVK